jgi:nitrogenase molybdenum-iron protein alpha/beta subunit
MAKIYSATKAPTSLARKTAKKSHEHFLKIIAEGAGKMPSKLSKDEQKQVLPMCDPWRSSLAGVTAAVSIEC